MTMREWILSQPEVSAIRLETGVDGGSWYEVCLKDGRRGNLGEHLWNPDSSIPLEVERAKLMQHGIRALILNAEQPRNLAQELIPRPLDICGDCGLPHDVSIAHGDCDEDER